MVFWKSLFSGGDTATEVKAGAAVGTPLYVTGIKLPANSQVYFSTVETSMYTSWRNCAISLVGHVVHCGR